MRLRSSNRDILVLVVAVLLILLGSIVFWTRRSQTTNGWASRVSIPTERLFYEGNSFPRTEHFADVRSKGPPAWPGHGVNPDLLEKEWSAHSGVILDEEIITFADPKRAAEYYDQHDARKIAVYDVGADNGFVGHYRPYAAPGRADKSAYFCAASFPEGCASWTWWSRHGQYTIELTYLSLFPDRSVYVPEAEFRGLIHTTGSVIAHALR